MRIKSQQTSQLLPPWAGWWRHALIESLIHFHALRQWLAFPIMSIIRSLFFILCFFYTAILYGLHVADRTSTHCCHHIEMAPRGIFPSSLIVYVGSLFDTAFWPFTACGQGFRQGSLRTLLRVICFMGQDRRPINNACAASRRGLLQPSLLASADRSSPIWIVCMISEMLWMGPSGAFEFRHWALFVIIKIYEY